MFLLLLNMSTMGLDQHSVLNMQLKNKGKMNERKSPRALKRLALYSNIFCMQPTFLPRGNAQEIQMKTKQEGDGVPGVVQYYPNTSHLNIIYFNKMPLLII